MWNRNPHLIKSTRGQNSTPHFSAENSEKATKVESKILETQTLYIYIHIHTYTFIYISTQVSIYFIHWIPSLPCLAYMYIHMHIILLKYVLQFFFNMTDPWLDKSYRFGSLELLLQRKTCIHVFYSLFYRRVTFNHFHMPFLSPNKTEIKLECPQVLMS